MARLLAVVVSLLVAAGGVLASSGLVATVGPFLMRHGGSPLFTILPILVALGTGVFIAIRSARANRIDPGL